MATFNSAQDGNWSADATWTEAGHPVANDDIAIIAHDVVYDMGDSAVTWGNITLNSGGVLIFPTASDSTLSLNATGILTINSGGELRIGTSGTPIDAANHAYFYPPQGAAERYVFVLNDGGIINIYGDPAFYGSERYAYLDSNWTAGQTLYVTGDFSAKWQSGQKFYIHENKVYVSHQSDGHVYTIDTVGAYDSGNDRTPITITEVAPGLTFTATFNGHTSKLIMLSRNVELADPVATWGVRDYSSYTERIRFDNNQAAGNDNIRVKDAVFYGWDRVIYGGKNFNGENLVFISNGSVFSSVICIQVTCDCVSNYNALLNCTNSQIIGNLVSNQNGIYESSNNKTIGDLVSNYRGVYLSTNSQIIGNLVSNYRSVYFGKDIQVAGNLNGNTTDVLLVSLLKYNTVLGDCLLDGTDRRKIRIYENSGNLLPLVSGDAHWQAPDSGQPWILEATPNSYCAVGWVRQMELDPLGELAQYVNSGSRTITIKIYPVGWTTPLDQDDIYIEARYLDSAAGITRTTIQTTGETYANGAWRSMTVSFSPSQSGIVYFNVILTNYEAACYVLIDIKPTFS